MTVVCHVVNLPVNREESFRINGGPCLSALSCFSLDLGCCEKQVCDRTSVSTVTRRRPLQILGSCGNGWMASLERGLGMH